MLPGLVTLWCCRTLLHRSPWHALLLRLHSHHVSLIGQARRSGTPPRESYRHPGKSSRPRPPARFSEHRQAGDGLAGAGAGVSHGRSFFRGCLSGHRRRYVGINVSSGVMLAMNPWLNMVLCSGVPECVGCCVSPLLTLLVTDEAVLPRSIPLCCYVGNYWGPDRASSTRRIVCT